MRKQPGFTVWFTGPSGAGKTTLAGLLAERLEGTGIDYELLDGDRLRTTLCRDLGYSREDRNENVRRLSFVSNLLASHGVVAIVAAISPFREARDLAKEATPNFLEVFVDCPLETLIQRDVKGLYVRAIGGLIPNFTGISDPYEAPLHPDVHLRTDCQSKEECVTAVMQKLQEVRWL